MINVALNGEPWRSTILKQMAYHTPCSTLRGSLITFFLPHQENKLDSKVIARVFPTRWTGKNVDIYLADISLHVL